MNQKREAKLYMYDTLIDGCEEDAAIPPIVPAFDDTLTIFKGKVDDIHTKAIDLDKDTTGNAIDKNKAKENAAQAFDDAASSISSYAASVNNNELKEEMHFSFRSLMRLKDMDFGSAIGLILQRAQDNLAALAPYGIVAATITSLQGYQTAWNNAKTKPAGAKGARKAIDTAITGLFKECDDLLKDQLDNSIAPFRISHPDFYNTYFNNRNIIDNPASATQFSGTIVITGTETPIPLAVVEVVGTQFKAVTDIDGKYSLKCPKPGIKNLKITADGFAVKTVSNQLLKLGQTTVVDVGLIAS